MEKIKITYNNKNTEYNDLKETYDKLVKGNKEVIVTGNFNWEMK